MATLREVLCVDGPARAAGLADLGRELTSIDYEIQSRTATLRTMRESSCKINVLRSNMTDFAEIPDALQSQVIDAVAKVLEADVERLVGRRNALVDTKCANGD